MVGMEEDEHICIKCDRPIARVGAAAGQYAPVGGGGGASSKGGGGGGGRGGATAALWQQLQQQQRGQQGEEGQGGEEGGDVPTAGAMAPPLPPMMASSFVMVARMADMSMSFLHVQGPYSSHLPRQPSTAFTGVCLIINPYPYGWHAHAKNTEAAAAATMASQHAHAAAAAHHHRQQQNQNQNQGPGQGQLGRVAGLSEHLKRAETVLKYGAGQVGMFVLVCVCVVVNAYV